MSFEKGFTLQNIRLRVAYDGTDYGGFQIQKNSVTVQEKLEKALSKVYGTDIRVRGAGRTDSGAHALGQAVNYKAKPFLPVERIPWVLNEKLPKDIVVWEAAQVPEEFHAIYHARAKTYTYTIDTAVFIQVLRRRYAWHCPFPVNIKLMEEGCRIFKGKHDFRAFRASGTDIKNTVRTIFHAGVTENKEEQTIVFRVEGSGFLYKMVRFMAGTLVRMGKGVLSPADLKKALEGSSAHRIAPALPARGLCLEKVDYGEFEGE